MTPAEVEEIQRRRREHLDRIEAARSRMTRDLSARELEILRLTAEGLTTARVGATLGLATFTIKTHRARILEVLGAANIAHAVHLAHVARLL